MLLLCFCKFTNGGVGVILRFKSKQRLHPQGRKANIFDSYFAAVLLEATNYVTYDALP